MGISTQNLLFLQIVFDKNILAFFVCWLRWDAPSPGIYGLRWGAPLYELLLYWGAPASNVLPEGAAATNSLVAFDDFFLPCSHGGFSSKARWGSAGAPSFEGLLVDVLPSHQ